MKTVGHFLYFMQLTIAGSDGEIDENEKEALYANVNSAEMMDMMMGMGAFAGEQDQREKYNEAVNYYNMHLRNGTLEQAFCQCAGGIAMDVEWDMEALSAFYNGLVGIAAADGVIEHGEDRLLEFIKGEWGI